MPLNIVTQLLADWLLIGLVVLALLAFAAVVCGLAGYLPSWYLLRRASLRTPIDLARLDAVVQITERRRDPS